MAPRVRGPRLVAALAACGACVGSVGAALVPAEAASELQLRGVRPLRRGDEACRAAAALDDGLCLQAAFRRRCPTQCGAREALLDASLARARAVGAGFAQAHSPIVSVMQSVCDEVLAERAGGQSAAGEDHVYLERSLRHALGQLDRAFLLAAEGEAGGPSPHVVSWGYPLTVVEALAFKMHITDAIFKVPRNGTHGRIFTELASLVLAHGWDAAEPRAFYDSEVYLQGGEEMPADLGWLNEDLGTLLTYVLHGGTHAYRKVPWRLSTLGYDMDFAVYKLPEVQGRPLTIGLVADWGAGSAEAVQLLRELEKQKPDVVIHLGDTYYSGTPREAREYFLEPMRAVFGEETVILQVPGNHDYYAEGGRGFFEVIDELGHQDASFFVLRGAHWQILALDTGLLDSFNLNGDLQFGPARVNQALQDTLTFLPEDHAVWARHQLKVGKQLGLKTIIVSHHQLFSRAESLGVANSFMREAATAPDRLSRKYFTNEFSVPSEKLPGMLPGTVRPAANTRLMHQFPKELLDDVTVWYWGHEHTAAVFEPYAGLQRGRLLGNGAIAVPKDYDIYQNHGATEGSPWGGLPQIVNGSITGTGDLFWNLGFVVLTLDGDRGRAAHYEMQDKVVDGDAGVRWGSAEQKFTEEY